MTFEELLAAQGVSEDVIAKIVAAMKENHFTTEQNMDIRYQKLKEQVDNANKLIDEMKKNDKTEEMQKRIGEYEDTVKNLNAELEKTKLDSAIRTALMDAKATDIDYMSYKLRQKGEIKLDDKGKIENVDNLIKDLKAEHPSQFESGDKGKVKVAAKKLESGDNNTNKGGNVTRKVLDKMSYLERIKFKKDNPELYKELMESEPKNEMDEETTSEE